MLSQPRPASNRNGDKESSIVLAFGWSWAGRIAVGNRIGTVCRGKARQVGFVSSLSGGIHVWRSVAWPGTGPRSVMAVNEWPAWLVLDVFFPPRARAWAAFAWCSFSVRVAFLAPRVLGVFPRLDCAWNWRGFPSSVWPACCILWCAGVTLT